MQQQAPAQVPPGCERAKSWRVKPRASSSATASASPIASVAVVLAVGARFSGQASSGTLTSSTTFAAPASVELRVAGHHDERHAEPLQMRHQHDELGRLAGVGDGEHDVGARDHAEIAVARLGGMQEEGGRAGAGERRGDLAGDVAGLAHAGDDHPALAGQADAAGRGEARVEARTAAPRRRALRCSAPCARRSSSCASLAEAWAGCMQRQC